MRRLSVRLFVSHLAVALTGGLITFALVRLLVPRIYDDAAHGLGLGAGAANRQGAAMRRLIAESVDRSLLIGVAAGSLVALATGLYLSWRLLAPLRDMQRATRQLATGDYRLQVARPGTAELAALADDVNALAGALARTDARRVRLVSEVAHEMRTPLTVIDGYVEGMIDGVFDTGAERLGRISSEVRKLRRLADDLSTLSRAEEGRLVVRMIEVDLAEVIRRTAERFTPQFEEAGVRLDTRADETIIGHADPDRLAQVVANLLGNALRATRDQAVGEVRLAIRRVTRGGRRGARITVADNGVGLSAQELPRIFERFYRAPGSQASDGSGIGLTIARDLVRAQAGELTAHSDGPGQGTTLTVLLPLSPLRPLPPSPPGPPPRTPADGSPTP